MATMLPTAPLGVLLASVMAVASVSLLTSAFVTPKHSGSRLELQLPEPSQRWAARGVEVPPWGDGTEPAPAPFVSTTLGLAVFGISATWMLGRLAVASSKGRSSVSGMQTRRCALDKASPMRVSQPKVARMFFGGGSSGPSYVSFDPTTELGVQEPIGFWDPLGLAADKDEAAFRRRRSVELKHGRVCMAASIGYIVPEYFKFPGEISPSLGLKFADIPNGLAALSKVPGLGWVQIIFFAGIIEGTFGIGEYKTGTPGEYGWKVITSDDPAEKEKKLRAELANGRLAMVSIIGMFFQDGLTGSAWGDWALYTDSPLRAEVADAPPPPPPFNPATQIGAMAPLGFFDPAGFSKVGDKDGFRNLRSAELKHGRVAMMAALGAVAQHFIKFPGFESVPSGLRAVVTPPGMYGFAALFALSGVLELTLWTQDPAKEAGDFGDPVGFGMYDDEMRAREINNGRFAMFAALGIISAELLTGKDAVQQLGA